jgi:hypothetical protein
VQPGADEAAAVAAYFCAMPPQTVRGWCGCKRTLSRCSLGRSLQLPLLHLFLGVAAASIVGGMRFLTVHQLAFAACRYRHCIALFRALLGQLPEPRVTGRFLAVSPDTAAFLPVVTHRKTSQSFVRLYPDFNMARARQFEYLLGL